MATVVSDTPTQPDQVGWAPGPAVVALGIIALIGAITISAIFHYTKVDDALKFWAALTGLVGVVTGAFVAYFFTRTTVQTAQTAAQTAQQQAASQTQVAVQTVEEVRRAAETAAQTARVATKSAETKDRAFAATLGMISDYGLLERVMSHPAVRAALEP